MTIHLSLPSPPTPSPLTVTHCSDCLHPDCFDQTIPPLSPPDGNSPGFTLSTPNILPGWLNPQHAEFICEKTSQPMVFFQLEIIITVLVSSF